MWWRELGEAKNDCTLHNVSLFATFLPKFIKNRWKFDEVLTKTILHSFFVTRCICTVQWWLTWYLRSRWVPAENWHWTVVWYWECWACPLLPSAENPSTTANLSTTQRIANVETRIGRELTILYRALTATSTTTYFWCREKLREATSSLALTHSECPHWVAC